MIPLVLCLFLQDQAAADLLNQVQPGCVTIRDQRAVRLSVTNAAKFKPEHWKAVARLTKLQQLLIHGYGDGVTDEVLASFSRLEALEELRLTQPSITDKGLQSLAGLKNLAKISITAPKKEFTGAGLSHLAVLPKLGGLEMSSMNDTGAAGCLKLTQLQELKVASSSLTDEGLAKLGTHPSLRKLAVDDWFQAQITDAGIARLAETKLLEEISLTAVRATWDGSLARFKDHPSIRKLELLRSQVSGEDQAKMRDTIPAIAVNWTPAAMSDQASLEAAYKRRKAEKK